MPCYDPETHDRPERLEQKVHLLTAMLCLACRMLDQSPTLIKPPSEEEGKRLLEWWTKHKALDRKIEEIRERFLKDPDSLTYQEEDLLNRADGTEYR